jgi:hypothetical protein
MSLLWCNVAAWAVALLYCFWKTRQALAKRRRVVLRQRVAYMLWVMAERPDDARPRSGRWRLTPHPS